MCVCACVTLFSLSLLQLNIFIASVFCALFMFAGALSADQLDGAQPNFHTRWRGGLVQTPLKMGVVGLTVWQPSKHGFPAPGSLIEESSSLSLILN